MTTNAVQLEEARLLDVRSIQDYPDFHERHRIIPAIFEDRQHKTIFDVAAGVGCAAQRIRDNYTLHGHKLRFLKELKTQGE